jgi:hypothetical protein
VSKASSPGHNLKISRCYIEFVGRSLGANGSEKGRFTSLVCNLYTQADQSVWAVRLNTGAPALLKGAEQIVRQKLGLLCQITGPREILS